MRLNLFQAGKQRVHAVSSRSGAGSADLEGSRDAAVLPQAGKVAREPGIPAETCSAAVGHVGLNPPAVLLGLLEAASISPCSLRKARVLAGMSRRGALCPLGLWEHKSWLS